LDTPPNNPSTWRISLESSTRSNDCVSQKKEEMKKREEKGNFVLFCAVQWLGKFSILKQKA